MRDGSCRRNLHRYTAGAAALVAAFVCGQVGAQQNYEYYSEAPTPLGQQPQRAYTSASYNAMLAELEARLAALEDKEKKEEAEACKEVDIIEKPSIKISGRVHFDYWGLPDESPLANFLATGDPATAPPDFIGFRRLRFGVKGDINETMLYKIEMEFANPSELAFKDAYLGWDELPLLQTVLLGNQKRPYGLDHLNSSRYNVFMERPFVIEAFNQDARRVGLQSYGVSEGERWNWRYGYNVMDDLAKTGGQYTDNYQSEVAGRLANTIWYDETSGGRGYAHWAVAGSAAFPGGGPDGRFTTRPEGRTRNKWFDTGQIPGLNSYQLLGIEGVLNLGSLSVVGEYQTVRAQRSVGSELDFGGGYLYVAYWLTGEYAPWDRKSGTLGRTKPLENFFVVRNCDGSRGTGWGAWQVAARYSHGDFSDDDILGGVGDSVTFGLNWWWNANARMQFNYIHGSIARRDPLTTGGAVAAPSMSGDYDVFGARIMVDF